MRISRKTRFYFLSFLKHDFKSSITVFFVALPLCLGISLASGVPLYSGLMAGIIGGIVVSLLSGSQLSVSGPAAGLTAICAAAVAHLGGLDMFFLSVSIAGILQIILGYFKLGAFTHFIPSTVIKGMLAAIGVLLMSKQIPLLIGYNQPDFWTNELFNIISLNNTFSHIDSLYHHTSAVVIFITLASVAIMMVWQKFLTKKISFLPASIITVMAGSLLAYLISVYFPAHHLTEQQYVRIPDNVFAAFHFPQLKALAGHPEIWKNAVIICFVASLETLLSIEAIDKLDPFHRLTPTNRELMAQGTGNLISGFLCGLPITAVIVRSSANAEAGAKTKLSGFTHGLWLLLVVLFATAAVNYVPYCVLAVILFRTGYNLAKPSMIKAVYKQGREQFLPFIITVVAILFTDLLMGVLIGVTYSIYFLVKHTYRAGYTIKANSTGHTTHYTIELAMNVSFLNKKKIREELDRLPEYSIVEIIGTDSVYIDNDILEIFQEYKAKAHNKHIELIMRNIKSVDIIGLH